MKNNKKFMFFITCFLGMFGIHKFIHKKYFIGFIYFFTLGGAGIGWIYDTVKAAIDMFKTEKYHIDISNSKYNHQINNFTLIKNYVPKEIYANAYLSRKTKKLPSSYVVFDTETTGLKFETDRIIELSAIKYINHTKVDEFSCLINPKEALDPIITKITGIEQNQLIDKPTIEEILPSFFEFIEDYTLIAHNAPFDIKMLACESERSGIKLCDNKIIDTIPLAKKLYQDILPNFKLKRIKEYLNLPFNSHRALDDCETCAVLYQKIFYNES